MCIHYIASRRNYANWTLLALVLNLKGQITNYKPAIQITSISIKSDSIPLSGEFGHIVRVIGVPFLALNCDRCTAESTTANFKHTQHKFSYIGDC